MPDGDENDLPRDAVEMAPEWVFEALVEAFNQGAHDALEGRDRGALASEITIT